MSNNEPWNQFTVGGAENYVVGPNLASGTTIAPTFGCHHVTGTSAISTITPPWTGFAGQITLIADGAWSLATGGNIKSAYQAVVGQSIVLEFDGTSWFAVGGSGTVGYFDPNPNVSWATSAAAGVGTFFVQPIVFPAVGQFTAVGNLVSQSQSATNAGSSQAWTLTGSVALYTKSGASLSLASSASATTAFTVTGSSSSDSYQGVKQWMIPVAFNVSPGNYWYASASSTASAGNAVAAAFSNVVASVAGSISLYGGILGSAKNASQQQELGLGSYSASSAAFPASIGFSELVGSAIGNTAKPIVRFYAYSA